MWTVTSGLKVNGMDIYSNQNYALTDIPEFNQNVQERIKLDIPNPQDFKVTKTYH